MKKTAAFLVCMVGLFTLAFSDDNFLAFDLDLNGNSIKTAVADENPFTNDSTITDGIFSIGIHGEYDRYFKSFGNPDGPDPRFKGFFVAPRVTAGVEFISRHRTSENPDFSVEKTNSLDSLYFSGGAYGKAGYGRWYRYFVKTGGEYGDGVQAGYIYREFFLVAGAGYLYRLVSDISPDTYDPDDTSIGIMDIGNMFMFRLGLGFRNFPYYTWSRDSDEKYLDVILGLLESYGVEAYVEFPVIGGSKYTRFGVSVSYLGIQF